MQRLSKEVSGSSQDPENCFFFVMETRSLLGKDIVKGTMLGTREWGRPCTTWWDNIKTWTGWAIISVSIEGNGGPFTVDEAHGTSTFRGW